MKYGFGKVFLASIFAGGALAFPWAQTSPGSNPTGEQQTQSTGSSSVGGKVGVGEPIPPVSEFGPAYSLLLAKEVSHTDLDGVIVAWAYGVPFCTQRQLLSESIEDFCNKNLTFFRVPKLDQNLEKTGEVTQISGYFAGCSPDVSLGHTYDGLYWVETIGMHDGIGDEPASLAGAAGPPSTDMKTNTNNPPPTTPNTQNSPMYNQKNTLSNPQPNPQPNPKPNPQPNTQLSSQQQQQQQQPPPGSTPSEPTTEQPPPESEGKAFKCGNDREAHICLKDVKNSVDIVSFSSCGQYAYTDKPGQPGTDGGDSTMLASAPPSGSPPSGSPPNTELATQQNTQQKTQQQKTDKTQQNTQQNTQQQTPKNGGTGSGNGGGYKRKMFRALKA